MITFFKNSSGEAIAVQSDRKLDSDTLNRMEWLLEGFNVIKDETISGDYIGPRREMITPWSTNAVEITRNMGIDGISRIEFFTPAGESPDFDPMLRALFHNPDQDCFKLDRVADPVIEVTDLEEYDRSEGLALSPDEKEYLRELSHKIGRPLTDSEVFGFSQVNSEHCRHKIFNGKFIIDGKEMPESLFAMIKKTSKQNPNGVVSAYKDNVAFVAGPEAMQFAPERADEPAFFEEKKVKTVISLKAETHNFPTTVEPFNGAATGTGGEIRDRMAGGRSSIPIAGTAVYMTGYPRLDPSTAPARIPMARPWLYQTPAEILIKASNGASDFGNKFGQPLICGSLLTFEHEEHDRIVAYDKVIMLAGGVGFGLEKDAVKNEPEPGMKVVVMGGDNYRIGMGGGAVSSVATGQYDNSIELNAVQRANPEMQKRVSNVVRALSEMEDNPCVSIHDHGAGGHLNALSELVEAVGGKIDISALPIGDTTLSAKEIIGNESQERMGLVMDSKHIEMVRKIADRERAPFYIVGETTDDARLQFTLPDGTAPINLEMAHFFGNSPKTTITDNTLVRNYADADVESTDIESLLRGVLSLEAVACKDWLTNKVDRSVTGRIARQQCQGELQLPLSDCAVAALDYRGRSAIATSIGHAPQAALIDPAKGSVLSIAEALTNISGALLADGMKSISLSANWMWPGRVAGEDSALYSAVKACSDFACALGINIPTGKDSLSMTQTYADKKVSAPGTVIISAAGEVSDLRKVTSPVLRPEKSRLIYIDMSCCDLRLGGSALMQSLGHVGSEAPTVEDPAYFVNAFNTIQKLIERDLVLAQHDVSAGGLITTLLEMTFANTKGGLNISLDGFDNTDIIKVLFAENPAIVLQIADDDMAKVSAVLSEAGIKAIELGTPADERLAVICAGNAVIAKLDIDEMRTAWYRPSYLLDRIQSGEKCAESRFSNYSQQPVLYKFPEGFGGTLKELGLTADRKGRSGVKAAIIREKGINGDREMAYSLHLAGFDVKDVHMTDLTSGRETLDDVNMIVFCGGFSNSDVLGSAKGWAGAFLFNETARETLRRFYDRPDTLSLGVCNGCQLMIELNLIAPELKERPRMLHNDSHKFESIFLGLEIQENNSVMLGSLAGSRLGIWVAHGEGKFYLPGEMSDYNVAARYAYNEYPGNPNGSRCATAALASTDGRHLAIMPHLERAIFPWQCGVYPSNRRNDEVTPWIAAFVNARKWIEKNK